MNRLDRIEWLAQFPARVAATDGDELAAMMRELVAVARWADKLTYTIEPDSDPIGLMELHDALAPLLAERGESSAGESRP